MDSKQYMDLAAKSEIKERFDGGYFVIDHAMTECDASADISCDICGGHAVDLYDENADEGITVVIYADDIGNSACDRCLNELVSISRSLKPKKSRQLKYERK